MNLLLDTHILLLAVSAPDRLPAQARRLIEDQATELVYSAVSILEVAIKNALGREDFRVDPRLLRRGLLEHGYTELVITGGHAMTVDLLPPIHKDPFDRLLIAQAQLEGMTLLTMDEVVGSYPGPIKLV